MEKTTVNESALVYENRERVRVIESEIGYIKTSVDKIMNNHLVHVEREIQELRKELEDFKLQTVRELTAMATKIAIIVSIGSLVLNFLMDKFLHL